MSQAVSSVSGAAAARLQGLPPVAGPASRLLVLGSFPGVRSLARQQYYAHPQNAFWRVLHALWPAGGVFDAARSDYATRCAALPAHGLALWDVYASCTRTGSLDSAIREATLNDFAALRARCPHLAALAFNGGESFRHARRVQAVLPLPAHRLPSTSPAHASWSFERKLAAWRAVFQAAGLLAGPPEA